jgi:hypothetical protein
LSWLQFNRRVQMEADRTHHPLLERAKFLAIVTSNLDEFVQVRYERALKKALLTPEKKVPGGLSAEALRKKINKEILRQNNTQYLLYEGIRSELYLHGVRLYPVFTMTEEQRIRVFAGAELLCHVLAGDQRMAKLHTVVGFFVGRGKNTYHYHLRQGEEQNNDQQFDQQDVALISFHWSTS